MGQGGSLGGQFPRVSGHLSRREAGSEIARVRKHPSPSPRRGSRKGRGRCKGTNGRGQVRGGQFPRVSGHLSRRGATFENGRGQVRGGQPGASSSKLADCRQLNCACPVPAPTSVGALVGATARMNSDCGIAIKRYPAFVSRLLLFLARK
jgi:hypothetical protein